MIPRVRVVVLGAGGIGSVVAAFFARAGHDVALVARGAHLEAISERGLTITGLAGFTVAVDAVQTAAGACDLLVLATKTPDTRAALTAVGGLRPRWAISLQNGVAKDGVLAEAFDAVVGATTMIGATRTAPGTAAYTLDGATYVGHDGFADAWNATGLALTVVDDVLAHEWAKQALQAPAATLAVASDLPNHLVHLRLAQAMVDTIREIAAVAHALGIELAAGEDYGFDVRGVATEPVAHAVARVVRRGEQLVAAGKTEIVVSMLQDVRAGRPTEIEETAGFVVAEADRLGVDVPRLRLLCDIVRARSAVSRPTELRSRGLKGLS
jgi:2-dehydropantoate 2-reductase